VSRRARETVADWLILAGGLALLISLFLPWSHQFPASISADAPALRSVPPEPTAWQVYAAADVLLALLAGALLLLALIGGPRARLVGLLAAGAGLAFVAHAAGHPPSNGADAFAAATGRRGPGTSGSGETLAIAALCAAIAGLGVGFTVPAYRA
jgi:hypothetical protein